MELSQLRAILALSELESITKAADHLHLSPPAVFSQLRQLEEHLGAKLYERVGRRLDLTHHGRKLAEHARRIIEAHDAAVADMQSLTRCPRRVLKVGCCPLSSSKILPHLMGALLSSKPDLEVKLSTEDDGFLLRDLRAGSLDAAFINLPANAADLEEHPLWSYAVVIVVPSADRGTRWRSCRLADLAGAPFIRCKGSAILDTAVRIFREQAGFEPKTVMEHDNPDSIRQLVKLGIGYSVLPYPCVADEADHRGLRVLRTGEQFSQKYGVVYRRACYRPQVIDELLAAADKWQDWWPLAKHVEIIGSNGQWAAADAWIPQNRARLKSAC